MTNKRNPTVLILMVIFGAALSGCDAIKGIKEYFSSSKKSSAPAVSQVAPVQQSQTAVSAQPAQENVLASVGTWTITKEEFQDRLKALKEVIPDFDAESPEAKRFVLDELVRQQLLVVDAEKRGMATDKDIVNAVEEFRRTLIVRETVRKLTESIEVSDAEALAFYNDQKQLMRKDEQWHVREIIVDAEDTAKQLVVRLLSGEDFAEVAKANSKAETAVKGGDLGFITEAPFAQMANALLPLEVGGISGVFKGPSGYYIVKLEEKKGGEEIPFEEIKEDISTNIRAAKQQEILQKHLTDLEQTIGVKINDGLL